MKSNNIILALTVSMSMAVLSMSAQTVGIAKGRGQVAWPPASVNMMTPVADGNFHVGIVDLNGGDSFCFADYSGGDQPERIAPSVDETLHTNGNIVREMTGRNAVDGSSYRSTLSDLDINALDLWTDRARYNPGESVWIQAANFANYSGATVRYRHGTEVIKEEPLRQEWWEWNPPTTDYQGYLVDVYRLKADGSEEVLASIGVDVSSDWKRFPRYGYTAWYEPGKEQWISGDVAFLNRRHINAVQFQDWHWKHHRPYCGDAVYTDIARREISLNVIKEFINAQHGYNMKSIFYNLGFGALEGDGAASDGVKEEWYYFKDSNHRQKDYHILPSDWKSNITFVDPGNSEWIKYLGDRNQEIYDNLGFDGYQVDQVGFRQEYIYDYWGNSMKLSDRFPMLLRAMKERHPSKLLIMNSVSNYGAWDIASSGVVDICYNELWDTEPSFQDIYRTVAANDAASGNSVRTVFAAYMNYKYANENPGRNFNMSGILLTDACIFALGAGHLELGTGYNMLCNEYFPNTNLKLSDELTTALTRYYDFNTAYENYLFDTTHSDRFDAVRSLSGHNISMWNGNVGPQARKIVILAREAQSGARVYHLLNFLNTNLLSWRDFNGDMPVPQTQTDIKLQIESDRTVSNVWVASPDTHACVPVSLPFVQEGRSVTVTVPSLNYWTMLVLE